MLERVILVGVQTPSKDLHALFLWEDEDPRIYNYVHVYSGSQRRYDPTYITILCNEVDRLWGLWEEIPRGSIGLESNWWDAKHLVEDHFNPERSVLLPEDETTEPLEEARHALEHLVAKTGPVIHPGYQRGKMPRPLIMPLKAEWQNAIQLLALTSPVLQQMKAALTQLQAKVEELEKAQRMAASLLQVQHGMDPGEQWTHDPKTMKLKRDF